MICCTKFDPMLMRNNCSLIFSNGGCHEFSMHILLTLCTRSSNLYFHVISKKGAVLEAEEFELLPGNLVVVL